MDRGRRAEGFGCKALRVRSPNEFKEAFAHARALMHEHRVPVVLEFIVERVTNVSMGTATHSVNEFDVTSGDEPAVRDGRRRARGSHADRAALCREDHLPGAAHAYGQDVDWRSE